MSTLSVREQIIAFYKQPCAGKTDDIDRCNCFLHSYTISTETPTTDNINHLRPFIESIEASTLPETTLTLKFLKDYAKSFTSPNLTFEGANWN